MTLKGVSLEILILIDVLADVLGLVGSSPTPGASDVGSIIRNKNKQREFVSKAKSKRDMVLQQSQIEENNNNLSSNNTEELERKIDSITMGLSRPYFNKILKELVKKNLENAIIICDYIIAEQIIL